MSVKHLMLTYDELNEYIEYVRDKLIPIEQVSEILADIEIVKSLIKKLEELCRGVYILTEEGEEQPIYTEDIHITKRELREAIEEIKRYIDKRLDSLK